MKEYLLSWGMLSLSVIFNAGGVFIVKNRLNELGPVSVESFKSVMNYFFVMCKSPIVILGLVLFTIAPFLFAISLSRMEITIAYPAQIVLNFLLVVLLAILFLGEALTLNKILGIVFVLISLYFLHK